MSVERAGRDAAAARHADDGPPRVAAAPPAEAEDAATDSVAERLGGPTLRPAARPPADAAIDFSSLYDAHPEYVARRRAGSLEQAQIDIEVRSFKLPNLLRLLPADVLPASVLEIGCATGELIAAFPVAAGGQKVGVDISAENIAAAQARFPTVDFRRGDFRVAGGASHHAIVVMSDVLEHVLDDVGFLRDAALLGDTVLVNLPLEDNWLNRRRRYGPDDASGHLRRYALADGLALFERAGLDVLRWHRVWVHETPAEPERRALRRERLGSAFAGGPVGRRVRGVVHGVASALPPLGRRLFASNLYAAGASAVVALRATGVSGAGAAGARGSAEERASACTSASVRRRSARRPALV